MKMKKLILVLFATTMIVGCKNNGTPVKTTDSENNFKVVKLFEIDGISVYRFNDGGKSVYFTNSNGKVQSISTRTYYDPATNTTMVDTETTETICNKDSL